MARELSLAAREKALSIKRSLDRGLPRVCFTSRQMHHGGLHHLYRWCNEQGVGAALHADGGWHMDYPALKALDQALHDLGLKPLAGAFAATRRERLQQGAGEHKALSHPRQHRLLCSCASPEKVLPTTTKPDRWIVDVDWRTLDLNAFRGLLVIENVDAFYSVATAAWPAPFDLDDYLVVYRGDDRRARAVKQLQQVWAKDAVPQIYAGDGDCAGVSIGLRNNDYTHLLLPDLAAFKNKANPVHAPAGQVDDQRWLAMTVLPQTPATHPLRPYLEILVQGRGLLQQAAFDLPWVCLPKAGYSCLRV